jgi:hypothetical protein
MVVLDKLQIAQAHTWAKAMDHRGLEYRCSLVGSLSEFAVKAELLKHFPEWPIEVPCRPRRDEISDPAGKSRVFMEVRICEAKWQVNRLANSSRLPADFYVQARLTADEFETLKKSSDLQSWLFNQEEVSVELIGWADRRIWATSNEKKWDRRLESMGFEEFGHLVEQYQQVFCRSSATCPAAFIDPIALSL